MMQGMTLFDHYPSLGPIFATLQQEVADVVNLAVAVQQIPAPTFQEAARARFVAEQFGQLGLHDVEIDGLGNVFGRIRGRQAQQSAEPVIVSAHSDTVFPVDTDLTVRREGNLIYGPGIADNSLGVAGILSLGRWLQHRTVALARDVWLVANVREEGLGDLGGMREVCARFPSAHSFIVVEGGMLGQLCHEGVGSRRYRLDVQTKGGHSWSDFGRKSAIHTLCSIIHEITQRPWPSHPKTTFNIGIIEGGTSINTIASHASAQLDLRSESAEQLRQLITEIERLAQAHTPYLTLTKIGERPSGQLGRNHRLIYNAITALQMVGYPTPKLLRGSTDANIPLSQKRAAVCIGLAQGYHAHRPDEYVDVTHLARGVQQLLFLVWREAQSV